jgi:hypothetical protein
MNSFITKLIYKLCKSCIKKTFFFWSRSIDTRLRRSKDLTTLLNTTLRVEWKTKQQLSKLNIRKKCLSPWKRARRFITHSNRISSRRRNIGRKNYSHKRLSWLKNSMNKWKPSDSKCKIPTRTKATVLNRIPRCLQLS